MTRLIHHISTGLLLGGILLLAQPVLAPAETVKTYYKQYSIFTFENQDYLCEPYLVQKDDWLYKIFRKKGEISGSDFPRFLRLFQKLNPKLSNIDAIEPGCQILIPLKQVDQKAYEQKERGIVEVPVLEFSLAPDEERLTGFIRSHLIQRGDTVSTLLDKAFLEKGGAVSDTGKKIFKNLNPEVEDINRIYLGAQVLIPDPAILSQPWFGAFLTQGSTGKPDTRSYVSGNVSGTTAAPLPETSSPVLPPPSLPVMPIKDLGRLKRYARLIQGTLKHQGKMMFPGKNGSPPQTLDLERTPLLTGKDGQKALILPPGTNEAMLNQDLVAGMKAYWKELQIQELNRALKSDPMNRPPENLDAVLKQVIGATPYTLQPSAPVPLKVGTFTTDLSMARITHPAHPDILLNPGTVYGMALTLLSAKGTPVLTLSPDMTLGEVLAKVLSTLGYGVWKNPYLNTGERVEQLTGILAAKKNGEQLFFSLVPLSGDAAAFLNAEGITHLILKEE